MNLKKDSAIKQNINTFEIELKKKNYKYTKKY